MKKIALALALSGLLSSGSLWGQADNQNLWFNPGFEELETGNPNIPLRWNIPVDIQPLRAGAPLSNDNPHTEKNCIELIPSSKDVYLTLWDSKRDWLQKYEAKDGDTFELSYWHRGELIRPTLTVWIRYYNGKDKYSFIGEQIIPNSAVQPSGDWKQHTLRFAISKEHLKADKKGEEITSFDVMLRMHSYTGSKDPKSIFLDDFSLSKIVVKPPIQVPMPTGVQVSPYEREIELSWDKGLDKEVSWEVTLGEQTHKTAEARYILTGLEPQKEYVIKVRSVKGDAYSEYREIKVSTSLILKDEQDETRLPYLRTLSPVGTANQTINLFYSDLYHASNAKFTYWIDDQETSPKGYQLTFPKKGKQELKVRIEETPTQVWILTYNLDII
ncbi:MAG: hypothetical protein Q4A64_06805 [Porphyromonadaceae bacterium]|nr:hypothetical protein [Porphyromonadaceae bacterium]